MPLCGFKRALRWSTWWGLWLLRTAFLFTRGDVAKHERLSSEMEKKGGISIILIQSG